MLTEESSLESFPPSHICPWPCNLKASTVCLPKITSSLSLSDWNTAEGSQTTQLKSWKLPASSSDALTRKSNFRPPKNIHCLQLHSLESIKTIHHTREVRTQRPRVPEQIWLTQGCAGYHKPFFHSSAAFLVVTRDCSWVVSSSDLQRYSSKEYLALVYFGELTVRNQILPVAIVLKPWINLSPLPRVIRLAWK